MRRCPGNAPLNAAIPLFTALVAAAWLGERVSERKTARFALGLAGVAALVGWSPFRLDAGTVLAAGRSLLASLSYAVGGVYAKRAFAGVPALDLAAGQQVAAGLLLLPPALAIAPTEVPPLGVAAAVAGLGLPCTAVAYLLYFRLVPRVGPTATHAVTYLIPGFGLLKGWLLLGEEVTAGMLAGLAVVLAGVVLATGAEVGATAAALRRLLAPGSVADGSREPRVGRPFR